VFGSTQSFSPAAAPFGSAPVFGSTPQQGMASTGGLVLKIIYNVILVSWGIKITTIVTTTINTLKTILWDIRCDIDHKQPSARVFVLLWSRGKIWNLTIMFF
jgi:hypothetical protein